MSLIEADRLVCGYEGRAILHEVSLAVRGREFLAIAGPNGAGKSTLLRALAGLVRPMGGEVRLRGRPVRQYRRKELARVVAFVFQQFDCRYEYTVEDLVQLGRSPHEPTFGLVPRTADPVVDRVLEWTETADLRHRQFTSLSGGEQQRAVLAMALAQEPEVLLLDEPSSHLDLAHQVMLFDLLARLRGQQGLTILVVSHDLSLCAQYVDRVLLLREGRVLFDGPVIEALEPQRLSLAYGIDVLTHPHPETGRPILFPALAERTFE